MEESDDFEQVLLVDFFVHAEAGLVRGGLEAFFELPSLFVEFAVEFFEFLDLFGQSVIVPPHVVQQSPLCHL